jgi:hypothetical protein
MNIWLYSREHSVVPGIEGWTDDAGAGYVTSPAAACDVPAN